MPRRRGIFGAEARIQREMRTVQLITRQILPAIPAARLINGLQSPADNSHIDHVLVSGYRLAIIGSMLLPPGAYAWNGSTLNHGGRSIAPPQLAHVVRRMQDIFPELNVTGWTVVHSTDGNLHEPVIDRHRRSRDRGAGHETRPGGQRRRAGPRTQAVPQFRAGPEHGQRSGAGPAAARNALAARRLARMGPCSASSSTAPKSPAIPATPSGWPPSPGAELHLVEPLGFDFSDAKLRRAGLDYHDLAVVTVHPDIDAAWAAPAAGTGLRLHLRRRDLLHGHQLPARRRADVRPGIRGPLRGSSNTTRM